MADGVVILSDVLTPVFVNESARSLLSIGEHLPAHLPNQGILSIARRVLVENGPVETMVTDERGDAELAARFTPLGNADGVAITLRDVTHDVRLHRIRRQFVINASHELKTPVTGLLALAEAISEALPDDIAAAQRLAGQLVRESERLSNVTQDLLDLSRVEDPSSVRPVRVDIGEVARHEATQLKSLAEETGVEVRIETERTAIVSADEQQVGLMIRNLIDNAVRYNDRGGSVTVTASTEDGFVVLVVTDTGLGIPLRDQARVFERFYRVDEGRTRDRGGTGLGLSIVRHVAELHGGQVSLTSELGEGSRFVVRLPLAKDGPV